MEIRPEYLKSVDDEARMKTSPSGPRGLGELELPLYARYQEIAISRLDMVC